VETEEVIDFLNEINQNNDLQSSKTKHKNQEEVEQNLLINQTPEKELKFD